MALSYAFGGNTGQSYDELQRRRMFAESLMQRGMSSQPKTAIEGLNSAASSIMGALLQKKLGAQDAANRQKATQAALDIFGRPAPDVIPPNPGVSTPRNPNDPVQIGNDTMAALGKTPNGWDGIKAGIFAGESGGDYNALFGFQNRPGGAFSNVQLTGMSVDDALKFADPNGQYGQHVKGQIGRVATPMGAYQVVGTTLAAAKKGLGLRGDEIMTPALQDRIGQWIYQNQGTGAWEGYKGPQQPQGGMDPQILMAMSDPNVSPEIKSALGVLLQQRIVAAQPPNPMDALALEKAKLEVDRLKNPGPPESVTTRLMLAQQAGLQPGTPEYSTYMATGELPGAGGSDTPAAFASLDLQAQAAGFKPGTPEYQEFMRNGGGSGAPAAFVALDLQAKAAGFQPGTPAYQEFMATRGAGLIAEAKLKGADVALLDSQSSKMAGLETVVSELNQLADKATYTGAGRAYDSVKAQLGMEPREAAVARAEYIAKVDNQVLPMLRDTFGAAFTVKEGESLRATLGDPNKTPAEKKAVLSAFIEQKKRDIAALQTRTGKASETTAAPADDAEYLKSLGLE